MRQIVLDYILPIAIVIDLTRNITIKIYKIHNMHTKVEKECNVKNDLWWDLEKIESLNEEEVFVAF